MERNKKRIEVSIIIPTFNRAQILQDALKRIMGQIDQLKAEVIIINDGSDEANTKVISKLGSKKNIRLLQTKNRGPSFARNVGIENARGGIIFFLNDDSFISKRYFEKHLRFHQKNQEVYKALTGRTINHPDTVRNGAMKWLVGPSGLHFNYKFDEGSKSQIPWYYFWTCNISVKREFLLDNNLRFCEEFPTAAWEDIEFAYRAKGKGLEIYYDPKALVYHFHEMNFDDIKNRFVSHGRGLYHINDKLPVNFLPFLVKHRAGKVILWVFQLKLISMLFLIVEKALRAKNVYPNFLMQLLVINWKAQGYAYEKQTSFA